MGNPAEADQPVVINWQRATGRSHGEATAAIGQGDLCGEFQAPGKGLACGEKVRGGGGSTSGGGPRGFPRKS